METKVESIEITNSNDIIDCVRITLKDDGGFTLFDLHAPDRISAIECAYHVAAKLGWQLPGDQEVTS